MKLIVIDDIIDMNEMFYGCYRLISVSEYSKEIISQHINYSKDINYDSNSYSFVSEEDKFNTFYHNNSKQLPDYNNLKIDNYDSVEENSKNTIYFPKSSLKKKILKI